MNETNLAREHTATALATAVPHRGLELPAAVAIAWSLAGGMLLGGAAVVAMIVTDRLSGHMLLMASATLFIVGALAGLAHGLTLGIFGRPEGTTLHQAIGAMVHGLLYLVPALLVGWLVAGWVAAMPIALNGHHLIATVISALAWVAMGVTIYFAGSTGLHAAALAYRRWPDRVWGTILVGSTLAALVVSFAIRPPVIWFTGVRLTPPGAMVYAFALTFWFYGPVITVGLGMVRRMRTTLPAAVERHGSRWLETAKSAGLALALGLAVALLALPFYKGTLGIPTDVERLGFVPAMALALSDAITDELFLRLFVFSAAFLVLLRYLPPRRTWAVALAVLVATIVDLLLHWQAVPALGLPGIAATAAYALGRLAIPAMVFGYLFWRRGLATALAAHATAGAAVGILTVL